LKAAFLAGRKSVRQREKQIVEQRRLFVIRHILRCADGGRSSPGIADTFSFYVNPNTTHDRGVTIPGATLARADEVIG